MHRDALTAPEQRVLGCLIEKRWTTPDQYPLSLNALRLACNQATNRDPVTDYDEDTVRQAAQRLTRYGLARLASGHTSRSIKFRHLAEEGLGLDRPQLAVLGVLLLRGPQTPGEIKTRSERMAPASLAEVEQRLAELIERGYVRRLERRPGQKEERYTHLLGGEELAGEELAGEDEVGGAHSVPAAPGGAPASVPGGAPAVAPGIGPAVAPGIGPGVAAGASPLAVRVAALEGEVAGLREELAALRAELGAGEPS
ncbi:MAG TPA: DUF480 domain-containing protein [Solirubrobacteraceae bacterium]|nr:DUF480 domain-containing protein [Solirubrobacteraceae bacterium]